MRTEVKALLDTLAAMPREARSEALQYIDASWCHASVPSEMQCPETHPEGSECAYCGNTGMVDGPPCARRIEIGEACEGGHE